MNSRKEYETKYNRSIDGMLNRIYLSQIRSSKDRGMNLPNYNKEEFKKWAKSLYNFLEIYNNWVENNYIANYKPSFDRLDDYKPYTIDNLQLLTWEENRKKAHNDRKNGLNNKNSIKIYKLSEDYLILEEYHSIRNATIKNGLKSHKSISQVLNKINRKSKCHIFVTEDYYDKLLKVE